MKNRKKHYPGCEFYAILRKQIVLFISHRVVLVPEQFPAHWSRW